jgi:hypothetical protein
MRISNREGPLWARIVVGITVVVVVTTSGARGSRASADSRGSDTLAGRAALFEQAVAAAQRNLHAWLRHADPETLLLPDRIDGDRATWVYRPHNSGADLYPYLILTAQLTDPELYHGRLLEMLRNEVRYTTVLDAIPADLPFATHRPGPPSVFGAGEYAKDGLIAVTEYLGRTPWFHRMVDMIADAMAHAPVETRFGRLPASDAELNGDYLQVLVRLYTMTGNGRFLDWARRIGDAYVEEVLPGTGGVPSFKWDFSTHRGERRLRLRDHGNETIVGLGMLYALEARLDTPRAVPYRAAMQRMLDRVLASANSDGMLYNEVNVDTLKPADERLSDNWGYVYGAVYSFFQVTGETKYRDAVQRVLGHLGNYRRYVWEPRTGLPLGSFDGYADALESAIYLVNREPVPAALDWIDSEMQVMLAMQRADGHIEDWYGEGNFDRTALLYAYMMSAGVRPAAWMPGIRVGAIREGDTLRLRLEMPAPRAIRFDYARHRRVMNLDRNYVRLNEFPEWYVVDENTLYRLHQPGRDPLVRLGSELIDGIELAPGDWTITPVGHAPYAFSVISHQFSVASRPRWPVALAACRLSLAADLVR